MADYLNRQYDWQSVALSEAYDELPLWSAAPGELLLQHVPFGIGQTVLDLGCGTGFPLLLLARRFGPNARLIGIDQWEEAMARNQRKINAWGLKNVELIIADASDIPLPDAAVNLITSNLGLNNFENLTTVLAECRRVLVPDGRLCISTNLRGTFATFYDAFKLATSDDPVLQQQIQAQEDHRPTIEALKELLQQNGFFALNVIKSSSTIRYADGAAFLNDYFIGMGFLPEWKAIIPETAQKQVFDKIESTLNALAQAEGHLRLEVPLAYLELCKQSTPDPEKTIV